jgi:Predicted membrane protein (DUF2157)
MPLTRQEAQQHADVIHHFQQELARLRQEQVLTLSPDQQQGLQAHHGALLKAYANDFDIDSVQKSKQLSLGLRIASFLGAVALACSVFFLFYQFWGMLNTETQVVVLITASMASFMFTMLLHRKDHAGYFTKLAALVSFVCFVINIGMLGQIFNIMPSDKALVVWAAFAFLLAYSLDLRLLLAAGILCVIGFISARTGTWGGMYWLSFGERPENFFPAALIIFMLPQWLSHARFTGFDAIYRVFGLLCGLLPILVLANWGDGSYLDWNIGIIEGAYQVLGFALCAALILVGVRKQWNETVNTGTTFFVIFLYTKLYDWWWEIMPKYLFFFVLALVAILIILVLRRLRNVIEKSYRSKALA